MEGQYPSTDPPTYQIIKVPNVNHMSVMKTSLTIIPMCPRERFPHYKNLSGLAHEYTAMGILGPIQLIGRRHGEYPLV